MLQLGADARCLTTPRRPVRTGVENYAYYLLRELARRDLYLRIFQGNGGPSGVEADETVIVPGANSSVLWPLSLGWAVRRARPDVLLIPEQYLPVAPQLPPVIAVIHDLHFLNYPGNYGRLARLKLAMATRYVVAAASRIVVDSESVRAEVLDQFPKLDGRVSVVSPACDHQLFRPRDGNEVLGALRRLGVSRPYVVCLGALAHNKNLGAVLEMVARLPELALAIVGPDKGAEVGLRAQATRLGLGPRISFLGYVGDLDKALLLNGAELLVFPSEHEGFGLPVLEAMACGTPVVTSDRGCLPEIVGDGGIVVPYNDGEALLEATLVLLETRRRAAFAERAIRRASNYSWAASAEQMHRLALEAAA